MGFDISRLRRCDQIIGASAIAFFIFLFFFHWYGYSSNATSLDGVNVGASFSANGWHTFTDSRWIWLITIIVALGAVVVASGALKFESPVQLSVVVSALGALSTLLILYRIIHHPTASASFGGFHASVGIKIGIWLGLIAAAALTYGGYLAMQAEGTSLSDVRDQASQAVSNATSSVSSPSESSASAAPPPSDASTAPAPPPPPPPPPPSTPPASAQAPPIPPPVAPPSSED